MMMMMGKIEWQRKATKYAGRSYGTRKENDVVANNKPNLQTSVFFSIGNI